MECDPVGATQIDQDSSGTVPPTVPVTPGAVVEAGREPPLDQVGDAETHEDMLDALVVDLEVDNGARLDGPEGRSEERSCTGRQCGQTKLFKLSSSERPESIQRVDGRQ